MLAEVGDAQQTRRALLLYDTTGWAYWRRAKALQKYAPEGWTVDVSTGTGKVKGGYDVVLQLYYSNAKGVRALVEKHKLKTKVVIGYNSGWRGAPPPAMLNATKHADLTILNNRDLYDRVKDLSPKFRHISNGVDLDEFRVTVPIEGRTPRVLSQASLFHRRTKGWDDMIQPLAAELDAMGIEHDFRLVDSMKRSTQLRGKALVDWYNSGTVYVVASRFEGTPNPALEAAACGCTVVATPVGNMPELIDGANGLLVGRTVPELLAGIQRSGGMAHAMQATIAAWHWRDRAGDYFRMFDQLLGDCRGG